jgi:hypothetical protein
MSKRRRRNKMATVYDLAVFKLTAIACRVVVENPDFRKATFEEFRARFALEGSPTYGLPPPVLERAFREAFYEFTGVPRELRSLPKREREQP